MQNVLTLIATAPGGLDESVARRIAAALPDASIDWLAPGRAVDIAFSGAVPNGAEIVIREEAGSADMTIQPAANRRKRLLVADMDSTIVVGETLDELAAEAGIKDQVAAITVRAMNGELDFRAALAERVGLLKGLETIALDRVWTRTELMPGAMALVRTMRAHGAGAMLVSGGFDFFTGRVRTGVGFESDASNRLEVADGRLTGRVLPPILDKDAKVAALKAGAAERGLQMADCLTVGDGANDLPMLLEAGLGVAFCAKPSVAAAARVRVNQADLTALLYLQGYRAADIVN
jgi:phosphoserine phosphatase